MPTYLAISSMLTTATMPLFRALPSAAVALTVRVNIGNWGCTPPLAAAVILATEPKRVVADAVRSATRARHCWTA